MTTEKPNTDSLTSLQAENARLREALEPFADMAEAMADSADDEPVLADIDELVLRAKHFRQARAALQPEPK